MKTVGGGVVRYVGIELLPSAERPDAVGESRTRGALDVLWGERVMESFPVRPGDALLVADGATVEPETWLFATTAREHWSDERSLDGIDAMRRFLDAKTPHPGVALSAPCAATVEAVEADALRLRAADGAVVRVRRGRERVSVRVGDVVHAGEPLTYGDRSHHRLLRVWGEDRLAEHMIHELEVECALRGVDVPRAYWALVVRAMLAWRRVVRPGDTGLRRNHVLSRDDFERAQRETLARGGAPAAAVTVLRGVGAIARRTPP